MTEPGYRVGDPHQIPRRQWHQLTEGEVADIAYVVVELWPWSCAGETSPAVSEWVRTWPAGSARRLRSTTKNAGIALGIPGKSMTGEYIRENDHSPQSLPAAAAQNRAVDTIGPPGAKHRKPQCSRIIGAAEPAGSGSTMMAKVAVVATNPLSFDDLPDLPVRRAPGRIRRRGHPSTATHLKSASTALWRRTHATWPTEWAESKGF